MTQDYINCLRKIVVVGNAHYLSLPIKFVKRHGLKKGDKLLVHGRDALHVQIIKEEPAPDPGLATPAS
jgi:hypothetical protein